MMGILSIIDLGIIDKQNWGFFDMMGDSPKVDIIQLHVSSSKRPAYAQRSWVEEDFDRGEARGGGP